MVGFVSEPSAGEGHNQASKPKTFKDPLEPFDPKLTNSSFVDSFLDFDAIKAYFEDSPDPERVSLDRIDFRGFERSMEMDDKGYCVKTDFKGPIADGSIGISEESKVSVNGGRFGCMAVVKEERVEFEREENLGCSIEEEMGRFSLVGGLNTVIGGGVVVKSEMMSDEEMGRAGLVGKSSSVVPDGSIMKSDIVSDQREMSNVSLVNELSSVISNGSGVNEKATNDDNDSESDSDSESESSSSSSSSSNSSDDSDVDHEDEDEKSNQKEKEVKKETRVVVNQEVNELDDIEEGEIRDADEEELVGGSEDDVDEEEEKEEEDGDKMVSWSDLELDDVDEEAEEETGVTRGPIRSKNELKDLPPVPRVEVTLEPHHQMMPVGVVLLVMGSQVIVEGVEKHNPLNEGSILWITEQRSPLGLVDEIFGPVKNPYYVVRYNSESEVPTGIHNGDSISFIPEFANHVLNDKNLYKKGYDASGKNDEELSDEEEFSDDEKEAEYKKMIKMSKRGTNDQTVGNKRKDRKKVKNKERNWKNNASPNLNQQKVSPVGVSICHDGCSSSSTIQQDFSGGTGFIPPFLPMVQTTGVFIPPNGVWANGFPAQQAQSPVIRGGFPANNMPWPAQNQLQHPYQTSMLIQQQFTPSQGSLPNAVLPGGQTNFFPGSTFSPWPGKEQNCFNQAAFGMGFQVQPSPTAINTMNMGGRGMMSTGLNVAQNCNMQPPGAIPSNIQGPQQFNMGALSGNGRKPHHRGGGRFAGRRGRHTSK